MLTIFHCVHNTQVPVGTCTRKYEVGSSPAMYLVYHRSFVSYIRTQLYSSCSDVYAHQSKRSPQHVPCVIGCKAEKQSQGQLSLAMLRTESGDLKSEMLFCDSSWLRSVCGVLLGCCTLKARRGRPASLRLCVVRLKQY